MHIKHASTKIGKISVSCHIYYILSRQERLILSNSIVNPYLSYCNIVWHQIIHPDKPAKKDY